MPPYYSNMMLEVLMAERQREEQELARLALVKDLCTSKTSHARVDLSQLVPAVRARLFGRPPSSECVGPSNCSC